MTWNFFDISQIGNSSKSSFFFESSWYMIGERKEQFILKILFRLVSYFFFAEIKNVKFRKKTKEIFWTSKKKVGEGAWGTWLYLLWDLQNVPSPSSHLF